MSLIRALFFVVKLLMLVAVSASTGSMRTSIWLTPIRAAAPVPPAATVAAPALIQKLNVNSSSIALSTSPLLSSSSPSVAATIENDILHFSYELENWLDVSKHPCQNFFAYVCAKSLNATSLLAEQHRQQEQQNFDNFLSVHDDEQLLDAELKLKNFFVSCTSARSLDHLKSSFMYRMSGGWPAIDDVTSMLRKRRNMTWLTVLSVFHEVGVEYFFRHQIEIKSNKRIVHLEPDTSQRYTLRKFEQLAGDVMEEYNVDAGRARLVALEILNFERNRREIVQTLTTTTTTATSSVSSTTPTTDNTTINVDEERQEMSYADFKLKLTFSANTNEMRQQHNQTLAAQQQLNDWDNYFKKLLGKSLKSNDLLIVKDFTKLEKLFVLLNNTTMTRLLNWLWIDYLMDKNIGKCQTLVRTFMTPIYQHIVERSSLEKVQLAQMYADLGRSYDELLPHTLWIDEISQQNSNQFLGRVMHMTLNGDAKLDADYATLTLTKSNFYRNLEKVQRFSNAQQRQTQRPALLRILSNNSRIVDRIGTTATEFMRLFSTINTLLKEQNLTTPLNFILVGEHFAENMLASGSSSLTPGAWRSMDSEQKFSAFKQCLKRQQQNRQQQQLQTVLQRKQRSAAAKSSTVVTDANVNYNINDLILKLLAKHQTLHALEQWRQREELLVKRLDSLLAAGRLKLSLRKLFFVGATLVDCRHFGGNEQNEFVHSFLKNSPEFTEAFDCRPGMNLYARNSCKVI